MHKTSRKDKGSICAHESILSLTTSFLNIIKFAKQFGRTGIKNVTISDCLYENPFKYITVIKTKTKEGKMTHTISLSFIHLWDLTHLLVYKHINDARKQPNHKIRMLQRVF